MVRLVTVVRANPSAPRSFWSWRLIPIVLFCVFVGAAPFLVNPGFFWDDWVWKFSARAEHIRTGIQLGVWWAGYLSQAINNSENTVLICRLIAFASWIAGALGFVMALLARRLLLPREALFIFLALCVCPIGVVRFVESMAMANAYIAAFWIGCAILFNSRRRLSWRFASMVLFVFSFHLNSMAALYCVLLVILFLDTLPAFSPAVFARRELDWRGHLAFVACAAKRDVIRFAELVRVSLPGFCRDNYGLLVLPFVFLFVVKLPSFIWATFFSTQTNIYSNYNSISAFMVFPALRQSFTLGIQLIFDYIRFLSGIKFSVFLGLLFFYCILFLPMPRSVGRPNLTKTVGMVGFGVFLTVLSIFPYVLVAKPPLPFDFYESRHALVAIPGIVLVWISLSALLPALAPLDMLRFAKLVQTFMMTCLLSACTGSMLLQGAHLLVDWMQQQATSSYITRNKEKFSQYGTFIFEDRARFRIGDRTIWNYEYTGPLVQIFGDKKRFGISVDEYNSLPANVALLRQPAFRERYNIKDYDFSAPHLSIRIDSVPSTPKLFDIIDIIGRYWLSEDYHSVVSRFFRFSAATEFIEADARIATMRPAVSALLEAKKATGSYPGYTFAQNNNDERVASTGSSEVLPVWQMAKNARYAELNAIKELGITFPVVAGCRGFINEESAFCRSDSSFLYLSDGVDFKLIYRNPKDMPYARQAYGSMIDEKNNGYGFWTSAATNW